MSKVPEFAGYIRVDCIMECYDVSEETRKALLIAMPDAYGGDGPSVYAWPEPDAKRDAPYKLSKVWNILSEEVQEDIKKAYVKG